MQTSKQLQMTDRVGAPCTGDIEVVNTGSALCDDDEVDDSG